jgi:hypothetical protein
MTAAAEDAPAGPSSSASVTGGFIVTLGILAIVTWLAGVSLSRGFGVHVPFAPVFILQAAGLQLVKLFTIEVAQSWHNQRVRADIALIAAQLAAHEQISKSA